MAGGGKRLSASKGPFLAGQRDRVRYVVAAARHPPLRGTRMRIGPGAHLEIGPTARMIIGPGFYARRDFTLYVQGTLEVGPGLFCNRGVVLGAADHVKIGEAVRIGERCSILDGNHVIEPLSDVRARFEDYELAPITIGDRVLISANSVILPGADIGADSVIAAGAVVRGTIPPGVLAAGAPAVVKRTLTP